MPNITQYIKYGDGTYSANSIECGQLEGDIYKKYLEGDIYKKYLEDVKSGKVRNIGQLSYFDENGNYKIEVGLKSSKFED